MPSIILEIGICTFLTVVSVTVGTVGRGTFAQESISALVAVNSMIASHPLLSK